MSHKQASLIKYHPWKEVQIEDLPFKTYYLQILFS